jgi:cysteine desulfurase
MEIKPALYFDNAATTPLLDEVADLMYKNMKEVYGNPSSIHSPGRQARVQVERARRTVSKLLGVSPGEIFFTSGGTEANNAILWGCLRDLKRKHFITSPVEHPAVLNTLEAMVRYSDARVSMVDVDSLGHPDLDYLEELLKQYPSAVVALMHANNEIGNLLAVNEVGDLCKKYNALFHSDTVQTVGKFQLNLSQLPFDFALGSAHKFHGPKGVGFMYVKKGRYFRPFINGGGQERNMRAGTENLPGITGMAQALQSIHNTMQQDQNHIKQLKQQLIQGLTDNIPSITFNGDAAGKSLHTIVNISLPASINAEMLLPNLDIEGIYASTGSACSSGSASSSHVLSALGSDPSRPSLRISFSRFNKPQEVSILIAFLKEMIEKS